MVWRLRVLVCVCVCACVCVCVQQPEASLSLRQPQIGDRTQRQHCVFNLFLPAGRSSSLEQVWWKAWVGEDGGRVGVHFL